MIKNIAEDVCITCGLCESICPMDVFRQKEGKMYIAYPRDCSTCMQCVYICPVDAINMVQGVPKKYDGTYRWRHVKKMLSVR